MAEQLDPQSQRYENRLNQRLQELSRQRAAGMPDEAAPPPPMPVMPMAPVPQQGTAPAPEPGGVPQPDSPLPGVEQPSYWDRLLADAPGMAFEGFMRATNPAYSAGKVVNDLLGREGVIGSAFGDSPTDADTVLASAADQATLGLLNDNVATYDTIKALIDGDITIDQVAAKYNTIADDMSRRITEARANHRGAAIIGDILGASIPGAVAAQGVGSALKAGPGAYSFLKTWVLTPGIASGGQAVAYRIGTDGDIEQAAYDGIYGMLGGMAFGTLFGTAGHAWRGVFGQTKNAIADDIGYEFYRNVQNEVAEAIGKKGQVATPQEVAEYLSRPEHGRKVIGEIFPWLSSKMSNLAQSPDHQTADKVASFLALRADLTRNYMDDVAGMLGRGIVRDADAFHAAAKIEKGKVSSLYDDIFRATETGPLALPRKAFATARPLTTKIEQMIRDSGLDNAKEDIALVNSLISKNFSLKTTLPNGRVRLEGTARELNLVRRQLGEAIRSRAAKNDLISTGRANGVILHTRNLNAVRDLLTMKLEKGLPKPLGEAFSRANAVYGDIGSSQTAYNLGRGLVTGAKSGDQVAAAFRSLSGNNNAAAFTEGVRAQLLADVTQSARAGGSSKKVLDALFDSRPWLKDDLRAMLGNDLFDKLDDSIHSAVAMRQTAEVLSAGKRNMARPGTVGRNSAPGVLTEAGVASQALDGNAPPASIYAWGKLFRRLLHGTETPREIANYGRIGADAMFDESRGLMAQLVRQQQFQRPGLAGRQGAAVGLADGSGLGVGGAQALGQYLGDAAHSLGFGATADLIGLPKPVTGTSSSEEYYRRLEESLKANQK